MNKNTFSLLSSNWMFTENSKAQLFPFLFNMIANKGLTLEGSLPETVHYFSFESGLTAALNQKESPDKDAVAVINIHHPIFKYDQECGPKGTQSIMDIMEGWKNEHHIKGIVLDVNSGGGQASGCAEFAEYIHNYSKPVVTFTKDIVGSAAYYFASASDFIVSHKHADYIGCIGSMYYNVNVEGILKKQGATVNEFYADLSPEKNKQSRELKNGNERPFIEHILNPAAQQFQEDVKRYRSQVSELALKGDIFPPNAALSEGLIDEIGTLQTAINKVFELGNTSDTNSITNNSNNRTMSKLNVPSIEAVIGSSFSEGETENGIILTDDQAVAVENRLSENDTTIATTKTALQTSQQKADALEAAQTAITTSIQNALEAAQIDGACEMTNAEGIVALSALIDTYGSKDGGKTTQVDLSLDQQPFEGSATQKLQETIKHL